ncbi:hypothetical protein [Glycomyces paridis]|uniref:Uncharacterized protein n=1 Tax=Glycomyces paridis TaxID=2126555 RepID=A0A4S8PEK9_9ACTN|nr:hypothetical protein [Glycomyces paridis]THV28045.1 hypothetical protein E9998_13790 [Glycomyces paridis]
MNSAKGALGVIAAVIGVVASVVGIMVGVQQLRGDDPAKDAAETEQTGQDAADEAADEAAEEGTTAAAPAPESTWTPENPGAQLILTTVEDAAGDCQYLHVDFDAEFGDPMQPVASSSIRAEATDDLIWNPCENGDGIYVASLTSAGTTAAAPLDAGSPSPEDCMDAVNAAGGANALLNLQLSFADDGLTGLSGGTSLCVWNPETTRLTVAVSESLEENDSQDRIVTYWVQTYLPA